MQTETYPVTDRASWLALRKRDVTASEIAAIFGAHPYKTALQVYAEKTGASNGPGDNPAMRRGRILEPAIAEAWFEETGERLTKATHYVRAPAERIGATPDYFRPNGEPVECKSVAPEKWAEWNDGPPFAYQLQALMQAMLTGAPRAHIAVMVDNRAKDFYVFQAERHAEAERKIIDGVAQFWRDVEAGNMPVPDYGRDGPAIASLFPRETGAELLDLTGDNRLPVMLARRAELAATIKAAEAEKDTIDAEIEMKIGDAPGALIAGGWKASFKAQTRKETLIPASTFRVLRITAPKEAAA
jgi:putative phage-type endonuclease